MIALFIGSWLPYALVATFGIVGLRQLVTPYSAELPVMLAKASAIWNPIVYALKHPRYRAVLAKYLPKSVRLKCCRRSADGGGSKTASTRSMESQAPAAPIALQPMEDGMVQIQLQDLAVSAAVAAADDDAGGKDSDNARL